MNIFQTLNNKKTNFKSVNMVDLIQLTKKTKDLDLFFVDFENTKMYNLLIESDNIPMNSLGKVMLQYKDDQILFCENYHNDNPIEFVQNFDDQYNDNITDLISLIENNTKTKFVNEQSLTPLSSNYVN